MKAPESLEAVGAGVDPVREGDRVVLSGRPRAASAAPAAGGARGLWAAFRRDRRGGRCSTAAPASRSTARPSTEAPRPERSPSPSSSPPSAALPLADGVPLEEAALLGCAALTGVGAVLFAARREGGFTALAIGAGGVGQFVVQGSRIAGAGTILVVDPVEARRDDAPGARRDAGLPPDDAISRSRDLDSRRCRRCLRRGRSTSDDRARDPLDAQRRDRLIVGLPETGARLDLDPADFSNRREKILTGTIYGSEDPAVALPVLLEHLAAGAPRPPVAARAGLPARPRQRGDRREPRRRPGRARGRHPVGSPRGLRRQRLGRRVRPDRTSGVRPRRRRASAPVRGKRLRRPLGATLSSAVWELDPGATQAPYHFHHGGEELLIVLRGTPTLRSPEGERELKEGEVVHFPRGPEGAHQLSNRSGEVARYVIAAALPTPEIIEYPDSGKIASMARTETTAGGPLFTLNRLADSVEYFDGESA